MGVKMLGASISNLLVTGMLSFSFEPYAEGAIWNRGDIGGRELVFKVVEGANTVESLQESASPNDVTPSPTSALSVAFVVVTKTHSQQQWHLGLPQAVESGTVRRDIAVSCF